MYVVIASIIRFQLRFTIYCTILTVHQFTGSQRSQANVACDRIFLSSSGTCLPCWGKLDGVSTYGAGVTWNLVNVSNKIVSPTARKFRNKRLVLGHVRGSPVTVGSVHGRL